MDWALLDLGSRQQPRSRVLRAVRKEMARLAVQRVLAGEKHCDVARSLDVHHDSVSKWVRAYEAQGEDGIASTKASGPKQKLTDRQIARLGRIIVGKNPRQLNFGLSLWTVSVVGDLIERVFAVRLHDTTVQRLLHRMGFSPQKPTLRAFFRDDDQIREWMSSEFPAAVRAARNKQATLLFLDEAGVHEDGPVGTTWGVRGKTPVVLTTGTRRRINVISAISPRGRLWFRCFKGSLNAARFIEFLQALLADTSKPIVLIIDRHPAHRVASVRRFLLENKHRITVHFLPGYAPELNPDEHVWSALKGMFRRDPMEANESFDDAVHTAMSVIKEDRATVRKFFEHPEVAYVRKALKW